MQGTVLIMAKARSLMWILILRIYFVLVLIQVSYPIYLVAWELTISSILQAEYLILIRSPFFGILSGFKMLILKWAWQQAGFRSFIFFIFGFFKECMIITYNADPIIRVIFFKWWFFIYVLKNHSVYRFLRGN